MEETQVPWKADSGPLDGSTPLRAGRWMGVRPSDRQERWCPMPEFASAPAELPKLPTEPSDVIMRIEAAVQAVAAAEAAAVVTSSVLAERLEETRREVRSVVARLASRQVA